MHFWFLHVWKYFFCFEKLVFCAFEAWKGNKEHNLDISYPIDASNKIMTIGLVVF